MSISPRCTSHAFSVNEYRPFVLHCRAFYRAEYANEPNKEELVSTALMRVMDWIGVKCACGRNMLLNADTREDFIARRETYV